MRGVPVTFRYQLFGVHNWHHGEPADLGEVVFDKEPTASVLADEAHEAAVEWAQVEGWAEPITDEVD